MERNLDKTEQSSIIINTGAPTKRQNDGFVKFKDALFLFFGNWKWFALSLIIALGCAYYYLQITPNVYTSYTSVMIKSDDNKGVSEDLMNEIGLSSKSVNITNEIMSMKTLAVTTEIVKRLKLNTDYFHSGPFHDNLAYGMDLPVNIELFDLTDSDIASFNLSIKSDSTVVLSAIELNNEPFDSQYTFKLGQKVNTPLGVTQVNPTTYYTAGMKDNLKVKRKSMREAVNNIHMRILATQRDQKASIIDISFNDVSRSRGEDVLATLVAVYNENWVKDRNQITASTTEFIKERLSIIEGELGNVDNDISDYKSRNLVTDVNAMGGIAISQMASSETQGRELDNRMHMTKYLRNYLTDGMHDKEQLPANSGINNPSIEAQIQAYNTLLLQRNNHLSVSSEQNPLVMDLDQKLQTIKGTILSSLDNELAMLNTQKRTVTTAQSQAVSKIAANPQQAKYLLSVERQQKVKESLYLFLLQKREENELSQAFTAYNTRVIEHPSSSPVPVLPNPSKVLALAILAGLLIPASIILLVENFNTSVRGKKDLESLHAPFVGEIPLALPSKKGKGAKKSLASIIENKPLVKDRGRNIMNEAFRVVRTNLEFILGFEGGHHVIMMTSMNPGSGKTFISVNLSTSLAIKGKKVIAVDLDMRKASLSKFVNAPALGISNYLSAQVPDYHDVIVKLGDLDVLPVGTIPPNPTELLFNPRLDTLMNKLKEEYDYVFIDCPPVEIVADAAIISRYAEMTLFIIRAHLLDRSFLPEIEKWYQERRFPNLSVLLNGTHQEFSHYGYKKYGYHRYGYHYGNYGDYHYTCEDEVSA